VDAATDACVGKAPIAFLVGKDADGAQIERFLLESPVKQR